MGSGAVALPSDSEFNRVSFLSHFNGTNNGVNNQFTDGSASNHTITANGNVTQGSFGPFARPDGEWGVSFDGDGDYLEIADDSSLELGSGNFTIECFFNVKQFDSLRTLASKYKTVDGYRSWRLTFQTNGTLSLDITSDGGGSNISNVKTATVFEENTWYHLALVRNSNTITFYVNGTADSNTLSFSATPHDNSTPVRIGTQFNSSGARYYHDGFVSNFRIVVGTALYTGNFTAPTSPLTAITNTKLLTCQSNRFIDNSASGHAITPTGTPAVTAFGPFLTSEIYSAATNGASAYMDGDGDYLNTAASSEFAVGTGDFTISVWVYNLSGSLGLFDIGASGTGLSTGYDAPSIGITGSGAPGLYLFGFGGGSPVYSTAATGSTINEWEHIALVRSGSTVTFYKNGIAGATKTSSHDVTENIIAIGGYYSTSYLFKGYMSDFRFVKGTAVYTSNFTPPTAPLTAITNTKLLLNMADGQAIDSAAQNNLTLYGTAKLSTAQKKFGDTSLLLDGNSDYVSFADEDAGSMFNFGATKWTIEGWFYQENDAGSGSSSHLIISRWNNQNSDKGFIFRITDSSGQKLQWLHTTDGSTNVIYTDSRTISNDTWYHFALVKNDNLTLYLNGTGAVLNSSTFTIASTTIPTLIGSVHDDGSPSQYFDGYIDDLRVSHMARYTSNFTAPSAAFPDKGQ